MRTTLGLCLLVGICGVAGASRAADLPANQVEQRLKRMHERLTWAPTFEEGLERARASRKPLFWLQLVGDLQGGL